MKFRKKPIEVEAIQWTGKNPLEVGEFMGKHCERTRDNYIVIETLEGCMYAKKKDWIIKGINGEFYPVKPDIFEKTYEKIN